ncbi:Lrp/AsnC family transcriptional regulator [Chitinimonas sp.]|uniref:Lrp/AsnC family transcriptional regulator n=1 Tax=Chitinimonas sp. TaxID=1934313 RepID=UPI002F942E44
MNEIDTYDRAILRELQRDSRQSSEQLAGVVALSATAVQRRIKRLRETGIIRAEQAVLAPEALGRKLSMVIQVTLTRGRGDIVADFKAQMRGMPEVQQCYYVTGEHDFVLIVTAEDMADYERLTHRLFFNNPNIQKFHTAVVMEPVKVGLQVPIPD